MSLAKRNHKTTISAAINRHTILMALSAFCVYTCMYAFRKPFTAAGYEGYRFAGIDYKIWLIIAQTTGYTISKFVGIKLIAELQHKKRFVTIIRFIGVAWMALLLFAVVPAPYNIIFLLLNGLPLGIIYGLVFSYLEGRRMTELLGAVLASSFIFASGFTQSVGKYVMVAWDVSIWWMPYVTGLLFFIPLLFFAWLLDRSPAPDEKDVEMRTERKPMDAAERKRFTMTFLPGLILLVVTYILLTILRDYRSNFASNIWKEMGLGDSAAVFTESELVPSIVVLVLMSLLILVKRNIRALMINHTVVIAGFLVTLFSTLLFNFGYISGFWWMTWAGTGLYMGYVPFNCMLFERLIASFKYVSTAGFIIYVADSFGYLGSDLVLLAKNFSGLKISWTNFFVQMLLIVSVAGIGLTMWAAAYFHRRHKTYFSGTLNLRYV